MAARRHRRARGGVAVAALLETSDRHDEAAAVLVGGRPGVARRVGVAVRDLARAFRNHMLTNSFDEDWYFNVRTMKKIGAK